MPIPGTVGELWSWQLWWAVALARRKPPGWGQPRTRPVVWDDAAGRLEALEVTDLELLETLRQFVADETPSVRTLIRWASAGAIAPPTYTGRAHRRDWPAEAAADTIIAVWLVGRTAGWYTIREVADARRLAASGAVPEHLLPRYVGQPVPSPITREWADAMLRDAPWVAMGGAIGEGVTEFQRFLPAGPRPRRAHRAMDAVMDVLRGRAMLALGRMPWEHVREEWRYIPGRGLVLVALRDEHTGERIEV